MGFGCGMGLRGCGGGSIVGDWLDDLFGSFGTGRCRLPRLDLLIYFILAREPFIGGRIVCVNVKLNGQCLLYLQCVDLLVSGNKKQLNFLTV